MRALRAAFQAQLNRTLSSRIVLSTTMRAEWPLGSSFGISRQFLFGFHARAPYPDIGPHHRKQVAVLRISGGGPGTVVGVLGLVFKATLFVTLFHLTLKQLTLSLQLTFLHMSLPQPVHRPLLHCVLALGSFGTS